MFLSKKKFNKIKENFIREKAKSSALAVALSKIKDDLSDKEKELSLYQSLRKSTLKELEDKKTEISLLKSIITKELINKIDFSYYKKISKELDKDKVAELQIIQNKIPINIFAEYYYEDNTGVFENLDSQELIPYYENYKFGEMEYVIAAPGYEQGFCTNREIYRNSKEFLEYRKSVEKEVILWAINNYPYEVYSIISENKEKAS